MNVTFYEMTDNVNRIGKELKNPLPISLYFKGRIDIMKPELRLTFNPTESGRNYLFMLDRYFFIDGVEILYNGLFVVRCSVDVLKTYENYIKSLYANVIMSESPDSDFVNTVMSDNETTLEYNLTDVFDHRGNIYMTTIYREVA